MIENLNIWIQSLVIAIAITTIATAIPAIPAADIKKDSATWQSLFCSISI